MKVMLEEKIKKLHTLYEVVNYRNALEILQTSAAEELSELLDTFNSIRITQKDILDSGGNESNIPKKFSTLLRTKGGGKLEYQEIYW